MKKNTIKSTPYNSRNPFMKSVIIEMDASTQVLINGEDKSGQRINKNDAIIWKDRVAFTYKLVKEETDIASDSTVSTTLLSLMNKGIIARAEGDGIYYINPNIFFNGDRVAFVKSYIMEKQDSSTNMIEERKEVKKEIPSGEKVDRQEYQREDPLFG